VKLFDVKGRNFMTKLQIAGVLKDLKVKNYEGYDRLPLRILNDGSEILLDTIADLFDKIYKEKKVPMQWKIAKILPLHKKGPSTKILNYRPISNLCALSKVFEKLVLRRLWEVSNEAGVDLTGDTQHGFKPNRSIISTALTIRSMISRALDEDRYAAIASLDLSAAFDVVDRDLLFVRLELMGISNDVVQLLKDWLHERIGYVEVNGNSSYMKNSDCGTVQGSVLGPILFSLFIRPVYDLEELTTYADHNYVMRDNVNLETVIND
jgi:hypothetical protein